MSSQAFCLLSAQTFADAPNFWRKVLPIWRVIRQKRILFDKVESGEGLMSVGHRAEITKLSQQHESDATVHGGP